MDPRALIEEDARGGFGQENPYMIHNMPPELFMADPMTYMMHAAPALDYPEEPQKERKPSISNKIIPKLNF